MRLVRQAIDQRLAQPRIGDDLRPSGGEFYLPVPLDNLLFLFSAIDRGMFLCVLLRGPRLLRSRSFCTSVDLLRTVNPEDY